MLLKADLVRHDTVYTTFRLALSKMTSLAHQPAVFVEPFAGGGIISLTVAFERLAEHVIMSELDEQVAAVWQTILQGDATWLADRIATFLFSAEHVAEVVSAHPQSIRELAFQTILRNRVNRGGILAQGAGMLKTGEGGRGLASRWYPETLKRRILSIAAIRDRITFIAGDGLMVMQQYAHHVGAVFLSTRLIRRQERRPGVAYIHTHGSTTQPYSNSQQM